MHCERTFNKNNTLKLPKQITNMAAINYSLPLYVVERLVSGTFEKSVLFKTKSKIFLAGTEMGSCIVLLLILLSLIHI